MLLKEMKWKEAEKYLNDVGTLLMPIGSMEGHGLHLPLETDAIIANEIAEKVGQELGFAVAPPVIYSIAALNRAGNVKLRDNIFENLFKDILASFSHFGCRRFFIILGHGGPDMKDALLRGAQEIQVKSRDGALQIGMFHIARVVSETCDIDVSRDRHAGEWETSLMLAFRPELVGDERIKDFSNKNEYCVTGDPTIATKEKGLDIANKIVEWICSRINKAQNEVGVYCNWNMDAK
jgi:creatinine amidohydrolase